METKFTPVYEPVVTEEYLTSVDNHVAEMEAFLKKGGDITVKPDVLNNTPNSLHLLLSKPEPKSPFYLRCYLQGEKGNNSFAYFFLKSDFVPADGKIQVFGQYENSTDKDWAKSDTIMRNWSGITAPYEDAICQALANRKNTTIQRVVQTGQPPTSRFIQNYLNRGYDNQGYHKIPEYTEPRLFLVKDFPPTPPATT